MGGIFFKAFAGGVMGVVGWAMWESQFPRSGYGPEWNRVEVLMIATIGLLIGGALGLIGGWMTGSPKRAAKGLGIGAVLGAFGAYLGYRFGSGFAAMFPPDIFTGQQPIPLRMTARILALAPVGALLGLAIGGAGLTWKRVVVGGIGGALGGAAAGLVFDPLSAAIGPLILDLRGGRETVQGGIPIREGEIGLAGRAVMGLSLGLFTGLFIGIVERVTRTAWVRLVLGRNEGREFPIETAQSFIGRSESAHVPLFGDMNVAPMHALIQRQGDAYLLVDGGSLMGTYLNGQRVQQAPLFEGAQITIGSHTLLFLLKAGAARRAAEAARSHGYAAAPAGTAPAPGPMPMPAPVGPVPGTPTVAMPAQAPTGMPTTAFPAVAPRTYSLVATDGPLTGQRFPVGGQTEVGREASGIRLGFDTAASRRHASISPAADGLIVQDLGSTNGTFVNGQRVSTATARPGDLVRVGTTTFRVE